MIADGRRIMYFYCRKKNINKINIEITTNGRILAGLKEIEFRR